MKYDWKKIDPIIIQNYKTNTARKIIEDYELSCHVQDIIARAKILSEKYDINLSKEAKYNIFSESLESYYWIGFLFADGNFYKNSINLELSIKDVLHLEKFSKFAKNIRPLKYRKRILNGKEYEMVSLTLNDYVNFNKIIDRFNINSKKTINPPIIFDAAMSDDQFLSLLIGYIDGDGNIRKASCGVNHITLEAHATWFQNFELIENKMEEIFNTKFRKKLTKYNSRNHARLCFSKKIITTGLKQFSIDSNLPFLERKWNIIEL